MAENSVIIAIRSYCAAKALDVDVYLTFVSALKLPSSYLHLKAVSKKLIQEYRRATKFKWLAADPQYLAELSILEHLVIALGDSKSQLNTLDRNLTRYPVVAHFLSETTNGDIFSDIYAIIKISVLRLSLAILKDEKASTSTVNNIAKTARQVFEKTINKNISADEIYFDKQKLIKLLESKNEQIWKLQKQFIEWIDKAIAPSAVVKNKNTLVTHVRSNKAEISNTFSYTAKQDFDEEFNINIPGTQSRRLLIQTSSHLDEDDSLEEVFEYVVDPEHPLSLESVSHALIYGDLSPELIPIP